MCYDWGMRSSTLEPELLSVFRLFTGLRLGVLALNALARLLLPDQPGPPYDAFILWFSLSNAALLMTYLSWPALPRLMGRAYLPVGLILSTAGPLIEQNLVLHLQLQSAPIHPVVTAWQLLPVLFVPLVLIGWQYNFRVVLLFCLGTTLFDWGQTVLIVGNKPAILLPIAAALFIRTGSFVLVGYIVARLMAAQREQRRALAQANTQLLHHAATLEQLTTSRERNRMAREMHDTLAHSLSGLAVQLEALRTVWDSDPERARLLLERSLASTRRGLTETRRALKALRASPLEDLGLALAVRGLAESTAARSGLELDLQTPPQLENVTPDVEQCIYRVAQEALENVARHADARRVQVHLAQQDGSLALTIADDGQGFDPAGVDPAHHFGLVGMRERAEILGGDLIVESVPGQGTTIRLAWGGMS